MTFMNYTIDFLKDYPDEKFTAHEIAQELVAQHPKWAENLKDDNDNHFSNITETIDYVAKNITPLTWELDSLYQDNDTNPPKIWCDQDLYNIQNNKNLSKEEIKLIDHTIKFLKKQPNKKFAAYEIAQAILTCDPDWVGKYLNLNVNNKNFVIDELARKILPKKWKIKRLCEDPSAITTLIWWAPDPTENKTKKIKIDPVKKPLQQKNIKIKPATPAVNSKEDVTKPVITVTKKQEEKIPQQKLEKTIEQIKQEITLPKTENYTTPTTRERVILFLKKYPGEKFTPHEIAQHILFNDPSWAELRQKNYLDYKSLITEIISEMHIKDWINTPNESGAYKLSEDRSSEPPAIWWDDIKNINNENAYMVMTRDRTLHFLRQHPGSAFSAFSIAKALVEEDPKWAEWRMKSDRSTILTEYDIISQITAEIQPQRWIDDPILAQITKNLREDKESHMIWWQEQRPKKISLWQRLKYIFTRKK